MWFFYVSLTVFFGVVTSLLMRILAVKSQDPRVFSVVFNSWAAFFAILLILLTGSLEHFTWPSAKIIFLTLLAFLLWGGYERLHFYVRKQIEASVTTILSRLGPVVTFIASIILLNESLSFRKVIGAGLIILGNLLMVWKNQVFTGKLKYLGLALLVYSLMGLGWTVDKIISPSYPSSIYTFMIWFFPILIIVLPGVSLKELGREWEIAGWKVVLIALFNVLSYFFLIRAFALEEASKVIMVFSTESIFVVLAGIMFLKERTHIPRKILAATIAIVGVFLIK